MTTTEKINSIKWADFETAYGMGDKVAIQLTNLFISDKKIALEATHDLWCGLCHQHVYISNAALPAYDILKEALRTLDDQLKIEILDILHGFSRCMTSLYYKEMKKEIPKWEKQLREKMFNDVNLYIDLSKHKNETISDIASDIISDLT